MVGRPRNPNREPATKLVRLTPKQWEIMVRLHQGSEPYGDTISRALQIAEDLRKKVKAQDLEIMGLQEELEVMNVRRDSLLRVQKRQAAAVYELEETLKEREEQYEREQNRMLLQVLPRNE